MTEEEYRLAVVKAKDNIGVGDHVVLSRRFYRRIDTEPFTVYRQLWSEPFRTYLKVIFYNTDLSSTMFIYQLNFDCKSKFDFQGRGYTLISKSKENLVFVKQVKIYKILVFNILLLWVHLTFLVEVDL